MNLGEITNKLSELNNWALEGESIGKTFEFDNFRQALDFVNKVGELAENANHHPDIAISYNKVNLSLTTHSEKSLTEKDFSLAKEIDQIQ